MKKLLIKYLLFVAATRGLLHVRFGSILIATALMMAVLAFGHILATPEEVDAE